MVGVYFCNLLTDRFYKKITTSTRFIFVKLNTAKQETSY
ncbi:hypothetical protein KCTC52924_00600 [Arenibacter antarcticus]